MADLLLWGYLVIAGVGFIAALIADRHGEVHVLTPGGEVTGKGWKVALLLAACLLWPVVFPSSLVATVRNWWAERE